MRYSFSFVTLAKIKEVDHYTASASTVGNGHCHTALADGWSRASILEDNLAKVTNILNALTLTLKSVTSSKGWSGKEEDPRARKRRCWLKTNFRRGMPSKNCNFQEFNLHVCLPKYSETGVQGCSLQITYNVRKLETDTRHQWAWLRKSWSLYTAECRRATK